MPLSITIFWQVLVAAAALTAAAPFVAPAASAVDDAADATVKPVGVRDPPHPPRPQLTAFVVTFAPKRDGGLRALYTMTRHAFGPSSFAVVFSVVCKGIRKMTTYYPQRGG